MDKSQKGNRRKINFSKESMQDGLTINRGIHLTLDVERLNLGRFSESMQINCSKDSIYDTQKTQFHKFTACFVEQLFRCKTLFGGIKKVVYLGLSVYSVEN